MTAGAIELTVAINLILIGNAHHLTATERERERAVVRCWPECIITFVGVGSEFRKKWNRSDDNQPQLCCALYCTVLWHYSAQHEPKSRPNQPLHQFNLNHIHTDFELGRISSCRWRLKQVNSKLDIHLSKQYHERIHIRCCSSWRRDTGGIFICVALF